MNILLHLPHHFMSLLHIHFSHVCERTCVCIYLIIIVNNGEKVSPSIRVRIVKEFISPFFLCCCCRLTSASGSYVHWKLQKIAFSRSFVHSLAPRYTNLHFSTRFPSLLSLSHLISSLIHAFMYAHTWGGFRWWRSYGDT